MLDWARTVSPCGAPPKMGEFPFEIHWSSPSRIVATPIVAMNELIPSPTTAMALARPIATPIASATTSAAPHDSP